MRKTLKFISFLFAAILLFSPSHLPAATIFQQVGIASTLNPVGSGARAVGMGGAFIAIADDATAASWNPAGLIQLEHSEFSVVGAYFLRKEDFSSALNPEIANTGEVDELNFNYISATKPFRLFNRNVVASINYQRLFEFNRRFEYLFNYSSAGVDLLQHKNFSQNGYIGALGLASAIEINPSFSFGATLNIWTDKLFWRNGWNDVFTEYGEGTQGGNPATIETHITDRYYRFRGINLNFGFLWKINEALNLGGVVKTPFEASLRHEFRFRNISTVAAVTTISESSLLEDIELDMPFSYGMGMALRITDAFSLSLDVFRTEWSDYILTDGQGNKYSPIDGQPEGDSHVKATTQVRLGGEYLFIGKDIVVPVRGGFFYDPEPSRGSPKDFFGLSIGSGMVYKRISVDVAYQFRWARCIDTGNLIAGSKGDANRHCILASVIIYL